MSNFRRIWLSLLLGLIGISRVVLAAPNVPQTDTEQTGISEITMQRTWCFGACPIDSVTLRADGTASYSGVSSAPRTGRYNGTIAIEKFTRLATWLEEQNFFEFRPEIGRGNIDSSDLIVTAMRDRLPYVVAFRGYTTLEGKIKSAITDVAADIAWQKDEAASASSVRGTVRRPLTTREATMFRDRKSPAESLLVKFALVTIYPIADFKQKISTITDQEGRFEFFLPPGRYDISASNRNSSRPFNPDDPLYLMSSQSITVEAGKFAPATLRFEDKTPAR